MGRIMLRHYDGRLVSHRVSIYAQYALHPYKGVHSA
jgi:hypothetical protein